jgi:transcriptional regulator with XRE-family HTH domain
MYSLNIREIRNTIGISQDDFCVLIGVSKNRLYREEVSGGVLRDYERQKVKEVALEIALKEIEKYSKLAERMA